MKKITLSLFTVMASCTSMFSQVVLQENFTSPFNVTAAGWGTLNLSGAIGTIPSWFQGVGANFAAFNGGANDYYASHFNNGAGTTDISNWLFTPVVQIENGAVFQFATRATAQVRADRLQIRFSTAGASTTIPAGPLSVGTYSNIMLDINPLYSLATTSAVSNGSVNGYPGTWTVYNLTVTGVPVPTQGRFAFRYFVENGGPNGTNSNYIGIDAVKYTLPCGPTVASFTTCANINTTLTAIGGLSSTTYSWSNGANTPSIVVNPAATTVYTLMPSANGVPCPNQVTSTITIGAALSFNIGSSDADNTVCDGTPVTLTVSTAASNLLWANTNQSTSVITVTPNTTTTYSVGGSNGACVGGNTVTINVLANPVLTVNLSPACLGGSMTINATGANLFVYLGSTVNPRSIGLAAFGATFTGGFNFNVGGIDANGCIAISNVAFTVNPNPIVNAVPSKSVACVNSTITMTGNGASNYTWTYNTNQTATTSAFTYSTGTTAGVKSFTLLGVDANGCSAKVIKTVNVSACTGIEDVDGNVVEATVFPNPFTNELKISGLNGKIEIFNMLGQSVVGVRITDTETINTVDLPKGAYLLKAYNHEGQEIKTVKLLKN